MLTASVVQPKAWLERDLGRPMHFVSFFTIPLAMGKEELKFPEILPSIG